MGIASGVALFYGDATLPSARRKGWQSKLIRARLHAAQREGCDLAVACVLPGSGSHRNYEREGFGLAPEFQSDPAALSMLHVRTPEGKLAPLNTLAGFIAIVSCTCVCIPISCFPMGF